MALHHRLDGGEFVERFGWLALNGDFPIFRVLRTVMFRRGFTWCMNGHACAMRTDPMNTMKWDTRTSLWFGIRQYSDGQLMGSWKVSKGRRRDFFFFAAVVGACRQRISQIYRSKVQAVDKEPRKLGAWNMGAVAVKWCSGEEKRGRTYSKDVGFTQRRLSDR